METAFRTSTCALSGSVPSLKVTVMVTVPSEVDCEYMYSMSSTPFTSCSIGVATVSAATCADAPGYWVWMTTAGGGNSGNLATGSPHYASPPTMRMMNEAPMGMNDTSAA